MSLEGMFVCLCFFVVLTSFLFRKDYNLISLSLKDTLLQLCSFDSENKREREREYDIEMFLFENRFLMGRVRTKFFLSRSACPSFRSLFGTHDAPQGNAEKSPTPRVKGLYGSFKFFQFSLIGGNGTRTFYRVVQLDGAPSRLIRNYLFRVA